MNEKMQMVFQAGVRMALPSESEIIDGLLLEQYSSASDFSILDPSLIKYDRKAEVLVATNEGGEIVAAMQATSGATHAETESSIQCRISPTAFVTPVLVLARSATRPTYRRRGLSSLLLCHFVNIAMHRECGAIVSTIYESGPWQQHMDRLGFDVYQADDFQTHVTHNKPLLLSILQSSQFADYVESESRKLETVSNQFPACDLLPQLKC